MVVRTYRMGWLGVWTGTEWDRRSVIDITEEVGGHVGTLHFESVHMWTVFFLLFFSFSPFSFFRTSPSGSLFFPSLV